MIAYTVSTMSGGDAPFRIVSDDDVARLVGSLANAVRNGATQRFYPLPAQRLGDPWEVRPGEERGSIEVWRAPGGNLLAPNIPQSFDPPLQRVLTLWPHAQRVRVDLPNALRGAHWDVRATWGVLEGTGDRAADSKPARPLGWRRTPTTVDDAIQVPIRVYTLFFPRLTLQTGIVSVTLGEVAAELQGLDRASPFDLDKARRIILANQWREAVRAELRLASPTAAAVQPVLMRGVDIRLRMKEWKRRLQAAGRPLNTPIQAFPWTSEGDVGDRAVQIATQRIIMWPPTAQARNRVHMAATWTLTTPGLAGLNRPGQWMAWTNALVLRADFERDQRVLRALLQELFEPGPSDADVSPGNDPNQLIKPPEIRWEESGVMNGDSIVVFGDGRAIRSVTPGDETDDPDLELVIEGMPRMTMGRAAKTQVQSLAGARVAPAVVVEELQRCAQCGETGPTLQCSNCRWACYCSRACQTLDWPEHEFLCAFGTLGLD